MPSVLQIEIGVTLEELLNGTTRKVSYSRTVPVLSDGVVDHNSVTINIEIPPGAPDGTHFHCPTVISFI